ncbi:MAG: SDR family oxidoreductase [Bacteroidia bacterium]|nr:SDR family oxidoreductase [Bacteroidia bacterium]
MAELPFKRVYVTGGAGYVGAVLIPKLLDRGYQVSVIDLMIYGEEVLPDHPHLTKITGDIRDAELLAQTIPGHDALIHLACISNDPSFDLNPELGKSINLDAFEPMVQIARDGGVKRFIYASSSSVYGIKDTDNVTEEMELEPLTDYSRFKAMCEEILARYESPDFTTVTLRPATVCGYSPRQRLDLVVNILTNLAIHKGEITVFGGVQKRPNIHIEDMTDLYCLMLELPAEQISGKIYNAGYENHPVAELAEIVRQVVGPQVNIITSPTDDLRSYHVSSEKIRRELGFAPAHSIEDAVSDLKRAFDAGLLPNSLSDPKYFNVKLMQQIELK